MNKIKALTFDTGGTILDWHTGFKDALKIVGDKYNYKKDWASLSNELRRRSLASMLNLGEKEPPSSNGFLRNTSFRYKTNSPSDLLTRRSSRSMRNNW